MSKNDKEEPATALTVLAIIDIALTLIERILVWKAQAKERGELTPEEDAALDLRLEKMFSSPAWKNSTDPSP